MTQWLDAASASIVAATQAMVGSDFGAFLVLCGAAAALLASVVVGGLATVAMIGDARAAGQRHSAEELPAFAGAQYGTVPAKSMSPAHRTLVTILFATETGNAEAVAGATDRAASRIGFASHVVDMADATLAEIAKSENLLVVASTWGEGEPPQRAADFYDSLMAPGAPRFDGVRFAVLALGDRAYARFSHFCETGRDLDARLAQLGGDRAADLVECDADYEAQAAAWIRPTLLKFAPFAVPETADATDGPSPVVPSDLAHVPVSMPDRGHSFEVEIKEEINLNGSGSDTRTFHIALSLGDSGFLHEPGDSLGFLPRNDPAMVEEVLQLAGLGGDNALHDALQTRYDITTLTRLQVVSYARLSGDTTLSGVAADEARTADFVGGGRQLIDLLAAAPRKLTGEQLVGLLRLLTPRLYSIANSLKATPDQVDLLVAALEYEARGRTRKGVASIDLAERHKIGDRLRVYLKPNPHFRLPTDPAQSVIMVGPGTGVAPFRAFMQERDATGATGRNWLFFGNRHCKYDFLYQAEWQDIQRRGVLDRLDVAFSRDQPEKIYVQDRLWEARHDLYAWMQDGAAIYVCGNATAMARDVNSMLLRIASDQGNLNAERAQAWLDAIRRGGRYLRDVY